MMISSRSIAVYMKSTKEEKSFNINNHVNVIVAHREVVKKVFVEIAMKFISIFSVLTNARVTR